MAKRGQGLVLNGILSSPPMGVMWSAQNTFAHKAVWAWKTLSGQVGLTLPVIIDVLPFKSDNKLHGEHDSTGLGFSLCM